MNGTSENTFWSSFSGDINFMDDINHSFSWFSTKEEPSGRQLILMDSMKDFRLFLSLLMKHYNDLEEKCLNSSKDSDLSGEFSRLVLNTRNGAVTLENCFRNSLKELGEDTDDVDASTTNNNNTWEENIKEEILILPNKKIENEYVIHASEKSSKLLSETCTNSESLQCPLNSLGSDSYLQLLFDTEKNVAMLKNRYLDSVKRKRGEYFRKNDQPTNFEVPKGNEINQSAVTKPTKKCNMPLAVQNFEDVGESDVPEDDTLKTSLKECDEMVLK